MRQRMFGRKSKTKDKAGKVFNVISQCYAYLVFFLAVCFASVYENTTGNPIPIAGQIVIFAVIFLTLFFFQIGFVVFTFILATIAFAVQCQAFGFPNYYALFYLPLVALGIMSIALWNAEKKRGQ